MKTINRIFMTALLATGLPLSAAADSAGEAVFQRHCVHCHGPGDETPGTLQLRVTRGEQYALLAERDDLAPEYVEYVVRHGLRAMPAFVPADLTDEQLEQLKAYLTGK